MRTTLTLDDDVARTLDRLRAESDEGLKDLVNRALRLGLRELEAPARPVTAYRTPSSSAGGCRIGSIDDIAAALALAEGDAFR